MFLELAITVFYGKKSDWGTMPGPVDAWPQNNTENSVNWGRMPSHHAHSEVLMTCHSSMLAL